MVTGDPVERDATIRDDVGALQPQNLAEECHRPAQIADCQMPFEEAAHWNHDRLQT
jgi:hypothetical protein